MKPMSHSIEFKIGLFSYWSSAFSSPCIHTVSAASIEYDFRTIGAFELLQTRSRNQQTYKPFHVQHLCDLEPNHKNWKCKKKNKT